MDEYAKKFIEAVKNCKTDEELKIVIDKIYIPYLTDLKTAKEMFKHEEGIILKEKNSLYEFKRSNKWLKFKKRVEKVIRFTDYEDNKDGSITLLDGFHRTKCNDLIANIPRA